MTRSAPAVLQQVGDQPGADRLAAAALLVLAGVRVVRRDDGDALRRRALGGVEHDERLHEPLVDRRAEALDEEEVAAADRDLEAGEDLAGREGAVLGGHELGARATPATSAASVGMRASRARRRAASSSWRRARGRCRSRGRVQPSSSCAPSSAFCADRALAATSAAPVPGLFCLDPPLDVALRGDAECQGTGGHILADDRPCPGLRAVSDPNGRDEDVVRAGVHLVADLGAVLGDVVVVGGDRAGAEVDPACRSWCRRCTTGAAPCCPSPIVEFFVSTKVPILPLSPRYVPGRR